MAGSMYDKEGLSKAVIPRELMAKAMDCGWYSMVKSLNVEKTI